VSALQGDPASCSQAGGSLRRVASEVAAAARAAAGGGPGAHQAPPRPVEKRAARRRQTLLVVAAEVAAELDAAGALLQEHASDLAEAAQQVRALEERAGRAGLEVADGTVRVRWGVSGVADAVSTAALERTREALQRELDVIELQLGRRRARLAAGLERCRRGLAGHSAPLRG
jgi:hypothetical protein